MHFRVSCSATSLPTPRLVSLGRAASPGRQCHTIPGSAAKALLAGASNKTVIISRDLPYFLKIREAPFLACCGPRALFEVVTVLMLASLGHLTSDLGHFQKRSFVTECSLNILMCFFLKKEITGMSRLQPCYKQL